jgi:predicted O-methyltransferase YrrM
MTPPNASNGSATLNESVFTRPRPDCPHPERWHATDDQSTELEVTALVAAMVTALQPDFTIETGTCIGSTAEAIGKALRANGQGQLVSLEVDPERVATARARCCDLPVSILQLSSMDYTPDRPIDFAFFDSLARLRPAEFERYLPWMHSRTIVGFHDTGPHHPVREHLRPLEQRGLLVSPLYLPTPRGVMFARVGI